MYFSKWNLHTTYIQDWCHKLENTRNNIQMNRNGNTVLNVIFDALFV